METLMKPRAVFAGSFDPFTTAHIEICKKASALFDVTVLICANPYKTNGMFSANERKEMIDLLSEDCGIAGVDICSGLLTDYCKKHNIHYIIRGLRYSNAAEEMELAGIYHEDGVETVMFPLCDIGLANVSSTRVREYIKYGSDWKRLVHPKTYSIIERKQQSLNNLQK